MLRKISLGLSLGLILALSSACTASDTKMERWAVKFTQPAVEVEAEQLYKEFSLMTRPPRGSTPGGECILPGPC